METDFWLNTWKNGRIGFHRSSPLPWLMKYWPKLAMPKTSRVLVPMCGKSPDLIWLAEQGHQVTGVELSPIAVKGFFADHDLSPSVHTSPMGKHYMANNIEIIEANVLALDAAFLSKFDGVYDRAAMIALPPDMRQTYVEKVYQPLAQHVKALVITMEYTQSQMQGPPFSVNQDEIETRMANSWHIDLLDRRDVLASEPGFKRRGLTALDTGIYRLEKQH